MDIKHLLDLTPPRYFCPKCFGLLRDAPSPRMFESNDDPRCPVCDVLFVSTRAYSAWNVGDWLGKEDYVTGLGEGDLVGHATRLAKIAMQMGPGRGRSTPLRTLYAALAEARHFVHLISYSFDSTMVGTLRAVSTRVPVRGILGGPMNAWVKAETDARALALECPQMHVRYGEFHQKLVVIDGLLALTGSANLTMSGYRKAGADTPGDDVRAVTSMDEVLDVHNRLFAPAWAKCGELADVIELTDASAPFWYRFGQPPPRDYATPNGDW